MGAEGLGVRASSLSIFAPAMAVAAREAGRVPGQAPDDLDGGFTLSSAAKKNLRKKEKRQEKAESKDQERQGACNGEAVEYQGTVETPQQMTQAVSEQVPDEWEAPKAESAPKAPKEPTVEAQTKEDDPEMVLSKKIK